MSKRSFRMPSAGSITSPCGSPYSNRAGTQGFSTHPNLEMCGRSFWLLQRLGYSWL